MLAYLLHRLFGNRLVYASGPNLYVSVDRSRLNITAAAGRLGIESSVRQVNVTVCFDCGAKFCHGD